MFHFISISFATTKHDVNVVCFTSSTCRSISVFFNQIMTSKTKIHILFAQNSIVCKLIEADTLYQPLVRGRAERKKQKHKNRRINKSSMEEWEKKHQRTANMSVHLTVRMAFLLMWEVATATPFVFFSIEEKEVCHIVFWRAKMLNSHLSHTFITAGGTLECPERDKNTEKRWNITHTVGLN